jgi:hypothetical protein
MSLVSQIRNCDQQKHSIVKAPAIETLVASLRATELALRASIQAEEEKTCFQDQSNPRYSMLAHSMRERADNIRMTIATLEARREVA